MTELYLADSLQEISPELIMEATLPLRKEKKRYWLAFAACFALVTVCSFTMSNFGMGGGADCAAPESESAVMEGLEDDRGEGGNTFSESINDSITEGSAAYDFVVYDSSHYELVSFDLTEMYANADTVVIGSYDGDFSEYEESGVGVRLYGFRVEQSVKGSAAGQITVRLPVTREVTGEVDGEHYAFTATDAAFFEPQAGETVMLFLQEIESGVYRKAQEPFTVAIGPDLKTELRSNLLLPMELREQRASTIQETEHGYSLLYTDSTLLQYSGSGFSGLHINELLKFLGTDVRMVD